MSIFDQKLNQIPQEWRQPLVDVLDTADIVYNVCKDIGFQDEAVILELIALALLYREKRMD